MAFSKSTASSRPTQFGHIRWNIKNPDIPSPNLEFYDSETKTTSLLLEKGERANVQITGKLVNATAFTRQGYNDRQKGNGEENEWRLMLVLDSGGPELSAVTMDLISDTEVPNQNTLELLNAVVTHLDNGGKDTPIQIGLYRRRDKNNADKTYPASIIRLPSGEAEDGTPQFDDFKNFVRTDALPPRGEPVMVNGKHLEANGIKVYNYEKVLDWASKKMEQLVAHFPKKEGQLQAEAAAANGATNPEAAAEEGVDLAEAAAEVAGEDAPARQRMAG